MTLSFLCYILSLNIVVCVLFFVFFKLFMFTNLQTKKKLLNLEFLHTSSLLFLWSQFSPDRLISVSESLVVVPAAVSRLTDWSLIWLQ